MRDKTPKSAYKSTHRARQRRRFFPGIEEAERRRLMATGFLQGVAFVDTNGNDKFDKGEPPKPGAKIELRREGSPGLLASTSTDANGAYRFEGLAPGTYLLDEIPTAGYKNSGTEIISSVYPAEQVGTSTIKVTVIDTLQFSVIREPSTERVRFTATALPGSYSGTSVEANVGDYEASLIGGNPNEPTGTFLTYCTDLTHLLSPPRHIRYHPRRDPVRSAQRHGR